MARIQMGNTDVESLAAALGAMGRAAPRRIVESGAKAAEQTETLATAEAGHGPPGKSGRATGALMASIGHTDIREFLGGAATDVYPQGNDARGSAWPPSDT